MKITPSILRHELIGLDVKVVKSSHPGYVGISGRVVDETRNTLTIQHNGKKKVVVKDVAVFHFTLPNSAVVEIDGKSIVGSPENRLKKKIRRLW